MTSRHCHPATIPRKEKEKTFVVTLTLQCSGYASRRQQMAVKDQGKHCRKFGVGASSVVRMGSECVVSEQSPGVVVEQTW